jgi:hypothetical protein
LLLLASDPTFTVVPTLYASRFGLLNTAASCLKRLLQFREQIMAIEYHRLLNPLTEIRLLEIQLTKEEIALLRAKLIHASLKDA